jgi:hypothetical protein
LFKFKEEEMHLKYQLEYTGWLINVYKSIDVGIDKQEGGLWPAIRIKISTSS